MNAARLLMAVLMSPALMALCAAEHLLVNALAIPELLMEPEVRSSPITFVMLVQLAVTVTAIVVE